MAAARLEDKWPCSSDMIRGGWLRVWTDLGRAPRTIDAYARGLAEFLQVCEHNDIDPTGTKTSEPRLSRHGTSPSGGRVKRSQEA